ncbi:putative ribonuclease H-like domain-containing protein [Tanacetum coccineum]
MAYTSSRSSSSSDNEVYDVSYCFKSCRKNTENLTTKTSKLREELFDSESDLCNYKRGLSRVKARLVKFKINESKFCEKIRVLKRDLELKDFKIENLTNELEEVKKERDGIDSKPTPSVDVTNDVRSEQKAIWKSNSASFSEQGGSVGNVLSKPMISFVKESGCPSVSKVNNTEKSRKPTVKYAEMYRSQRPRGNQRNWNNQKSQQLGSDFMMIKKACYVCGSFEHLQYTCKHKRHVNDQKQVKPVWNNSKRVNHHYSTRITHPNPKRNFVPKAVLMKTRMRPVNAAKPKAAYNAVKRNRTKNPTVGLKVPTAKPTVAAAKGNKGKAVKASARWIWKPKQISGEGSIGCSRHMTGNISYLSDYEPYDGGYVSFGYGGGKITGKGTIKTGKLEFENVNFVKELKYNLFSASQICDNKNYVLFTDSECIVLGRDFKLEDDRHVLLRTPRQQNMYAVDLKDIVPYKNLTCLIAKASVNESMLWHRRLGHLNFKTMNKLVRNNLVIGLPSKIFENDHSCVDCLKGKQHKASCKSKLVNSTSKPLHTLHMDLFGPTSISSMILRNFITEIENLKDLKVKIIRCDNGGEFRNKEMDDFCSRKGIKREFSNARTPQQNGSPAIVYLTGTVVLTHVFLDDIGCHVRIINTWDHLGKLIAKGDEGFFVVIDKAGGPNWLFDIESLIKSMNYIPLLVQEHLLLTFQVEHEVNEEVPESSGISFPTASSKESSKLTSTLTVETVVPTVSTHVPTITKSRGGLRYSQPPSISNVVSSENRVEDFFGDSTHATRLNEVEADLSNMETTIQVLVDCSKNGVRSMGTNGFLKTKDEMKGGIVIRTRPDWWLQGLTQEERFSDLRSANTPMDRENPWGKDRTGKDVDLHLYRSMIGSLMYLTASRPDIMFAICACARHQVTPKECHLHAVKRIFRYLKGHSKLGLWYPKESPFDLVAYSNSDYGGASQDRKSTIGGSASGCGQVLWIQNQLLDYGGDAPTTRGADMKRLSYASSFLDAGKDREKHTKTSAICPMYHLQGYCSWCAEGDAEKDSSRSTDKGSESTGDLANVLSSMGAANILASGGLKEVFTTAGDPITEVLTTARDITPYTRRPRASRGVVIRSTSPIPISIPSAGKEDKRKGKEIMTKPEKPVKAKVQEQMKIARIHAEEDLRQMINELDRSNDLLEKVKAKRLKTSDVSAQEQQESDNQDEIINLQQWAVLVREEDFSTNYYSFSCHWYPYVLEKIYKDKLREVYQIFRVGQAPKVYPYFESMLKDFDRDDLVTLWKLVKDRVEDVPNHCKEIHCLSMEGMIIYMLDDVEYPFQKTTLKKMLDHKCEVSEFNEDVIQMINLIRGSSEMNKGFD